MKFHSRFSHTVLKQVNNLASDPKSLYFCLSVYANFRTGVCWPSYRTILDDTKISNGKRVRSAVFALVDAGLIETWFEGKSRHYRLLDSVYHQVSNDTQ